MMTQSVGVPFTAQRVSETFRSRSGSLTESECATPDWSIFRRDHDHVVGELSGDALEHVEPRRVDAVVVGNEDAHQGRLSRSAQVLTNLVKSDHCSTRKALMSRTDGGSQGNPLSATMAANRLARSSDSLM